jgi:hypothetical protein
LSNFEEGDNVGDVRKLEFNIYCDQGDVISIKISALKRRDFRGKYFESHEWHLNNTTFKISRTDLGTTFLENELKDFQIKDFIKEIIWRTGLTPIYDYSTNIVRFIKLDDRVDFNNAQDLSHAYVERTNESYTNGYAQKNIFALKKNDDTDLSGDGYLYVYNKNIDDEKTIAQSKIYAPDKKIVTQFFDFNTNQYKIWQLEIKDNSGTPEITYKGLSGRFYFIRKQIKTGSYKIISEKLISEEIVSNIPIGINANTLFEEAVFNNYQEYQKIFTNFRAHNIDMNLTINDFNGLDLTKPVYFKQENAYYICNKVPYQEGEKSNGEFIKINKL